VAQFFKGNFDENTPVNNMFDCPVIAKCIRINPLEWNNHAALRFDLTGASFGIDDIEKQKYSFLSN
jgi:hypothetical protein